ncbi:hypothetical protein [Pseudonocardia asaccharolytica]|uniref:Uncharacterized protein n=1 Tax=Pseudonocardia asaccharolytica DSM 44247 = NBRC 16224 TaxID=1123024 RepID=A0A511D3F9_9PSEU|nr:hypothetical protein [Pseudonocardia asaccharolytica]GEL19312.1 hypothetical protein PA7_31490 [Pseudonocardia asaccharolytica DSM 44247 = NBRC 16224]
MTGLDRPDPARRLGFDKSMRQIQARYGDAIRILGDPPPLAELVADVHAIADTLDALGAAGARDVLRTAADHLDALGTDLAVERRYRTLGGPPPKPDQTWANLRLPPPPSASDPAAPPHHRPTRNEPGTNGRT